MPVRGISFFGGKNKQTYFVDNLENSYCVNNKISMAFNWMWFVKFWSDRLCCTDCFRWYALEMGYSLPNDCFQFPNLWVKDTIDLTTVQW